MADQKISQLNSLTNSTIDVADVIPVVDTSANETKKITYQNLQNPTDTVFAVVDDADTTKKVKLQVSGVTTGTTRTLTVPDANTTIVGTDTTQTLTNKTLTSPAINVGSDATGDLYYRNSGGTFTRLPIGTVGQILDVSSGGIPEWIANPAASDASYATKGVVKGLTDAATSGLTISSGVISVNSGTSANNIVKLDGSAKLPAVDGSNLTNLPFKGVFNNGDTIKDASDASTTQNIAHGLGSIPKKVRLTAVAMSTAGTPYNTLIAIGIYNGTTASYISRHTNSINGLATNTFVLNETNTNTNTQTGVITFDATNIIITWTKSGSPTGTYKILWEAEA